MQQGVGTPRLLSGRKFSSSINEFASTIPKSFFTASEVTKFKIFNKRIFGKRYQG
jgi:hypothetical protein